MFFSSNFQTHRYDFFSLRYLRSLNRIEKNSAKTLLFCHFCLDWETKPENNPNAFLQHLPRLAEEVILYDAEREKDRSQQTLPCRGCHECDILYGATVCSWDHSAFGYKTEGSFETVEVPYSKPVIVE